MGVANERSLAWGIARELSKHGATLGLTYQSDVLLKRLDPLAESVGIDCIIPCDVSDDESLDRCFERIEEEMGGLDFLVHAIAYSEKSQLMGRYCDLDRANFLKTLDISCYSLTAVCQRARLLMKEGGSIVTMTYEGARRVIPHYNVMGVAKAALEASVRYLATDLGPLNIRVNAISAGPVKTLAASGINHFRYILRWNQINAPLQRNTTLEDVGRSALYLLSDLGSGVTGEIIHVDGGYHTVGMMLVEGVSELSELTASMARTLAK